MRKFLTTCRNWVCGLAMTASLIGIMGAVSCSDDYDDSGLRQSISELESRIDALEARLTTEVEALQTMISGTTVLSCVLENDVWTITLSDGTVIEVDKSGAVSGSYPAITYIEEDGELYWAVVRDGETEALLVDGEKVPVTVVPRIKIDADTNEYLISLNGGSSWSGLGIYASEGASGSLFINVEQDDDYVYLTLSDDTVLKVLKSKDLYCVPLTGKQYFAAGETKTVNLSVSGISKMTVTKPDGWKASVSGQQLNITAPAEDNPYAETEGKVVVIFVGSNGQSSFAEVSVTLGEAPVTINIDGEDVEYYVTPELAADYDFEGYYYGVKPLSEFDPESILYDIENNSRLYSQVWATVNTSISEQLGYAPEKGVSYVVWALPAVNTWMGGSYSSSDFIYEIFASTNAELEVVSKNFEDATINVTVMGCDKYYAGVFNAGDSWYSIESKIKDINAGWESTFSGDYSGPLSKFAVEWSYNTIKAGNTYIVYVVPYELGKTYTVEDAYTWTIEIPAITGGGSATVSLTDLKVTITSATVTATASSNAYKSYIRYFTEEAYAEYTDEESLRSYVINNGILFDGSYEYNVSMSPDTKGYFAAVAITEDGKAGEVAVQEFTTPGLTFSDAISVNVVVEEVGLTTAKIKLTPVGDVVTYRYLNIIQTSWENHYLYYGSDEKTENALAIKSDYSMVDVPASSLTDGIVELTWLTMGSPYSFFVVGIDGDGNVSHMSKISYTPEFQGEIIRSSDERWGNSTARPTVSDILINGEPYDESMVYTGFQTLTYTVTPGEGCAAYYVCARDEEYLPTDYFNRSAYVMANGEKYIGTDAQTYNQYWFTMESGKIFIVWVDADGNYFQADEIAPWRNE